MRDWLHVRTQATPADTALIDAVTGRTWTYRDLDATVDDLAGSLRAAGVEEGDRVGVLLETGIDFVRLLWAVDRVGAALVPFNARLTPGEVASQRERVDSVTIVTAAAHADVAVEAAGRTPVLTLDEPVAGATTTSQFDPAPVRPVDRSLTADLAVVFTSGTTGEPKGVRLTRANLIASAVASAFRLGVTPEDRWSLCLPMYHMGGLSVPLRTTVYGTATVVHEGFDPEAILEAMAEYRVTGISLVPTMLDRLLGTGSVPESLRFALVGGGETDPGLVRRARDRGVPIHATYGMTETASQIATARPPDLDEHPETVGRPLVGTEVGILDEDGAPLGVEDVGEVAVRGPTVTPGYVNDDAASASPEEGWFRTGDLGYRDDAGRLFVVGRVDERIVTGGENVAPAEVRRAIEAHPAVDAAAVVGLPDEEWGERVAALVVAEDLSIEALETFLGERLAGYKRPRTVRFASSLPRTPSGTVDREAVRRRLRDGDP
ncbi:MAG: o-succinylbenzoate--CoA ligase [Halanaeroarchaeum sp.]